MRIAAEAAQARCVRPSTFSHFPAERTARAASLPLDNVANAMDARAAIDPPRTVTQTVDDLAIDDVDLFARHQVGQKAMLRAAFFLICP